MIRLNNSGLTIGPVNNPSNRYEVKYIRVSQVSAIITNGANPHWEVGVQTDSHIFPGMYYSVKSGDLCTDLKAKEYFDQDYPICEELRDEPDRLFLVTRRLIASVCLRLSNKDDRSDAYQGKSRRMAKIMNDGAFAYDLYAIRDSIKIDCREAVREYVSHGGKSPLVRTMVRGHWRNQACGQGRKKRKWIHIEPHWRGPIDAPISARIGKEAPE
jgi:hypothetical protein